MALPKLLRHLIDRENPHDTPQVCTGSILIWPGAAIPEGYLLCDGRAVSRAQYTALFEAIGTTYGSGDGTSTFTLPNLSGRVVVGKSGETEFNALGKAGGEKAHTLTVEEMPAHRHDLTQSSKPTVLGKAGSYTDTAVNFLGLSSGIESYSDIYQTYVGGSIAHNNLPPYLTLQYIIKY